MSQVAIHNIQLPVVEYRGQRVVTLTMIDQVHERPEGTARRNFNEHRAKLIEGADFFKVCADEIRTHNIVKISPRAHEDVTFLTEQGYLMLVKSLTDDLAWTVQRQLVSNYFRPAPAPALPGDYITALEHLLASKRSEQLALEQRDHAIATKAEIGSRREASAMGRASAAVRQVRQLENELGRGCQHATVTAVEKAAHRTFGGQGFRPLKNWCDSHGVSAPKVQDPRFGWVRSWPAAAWAAVYQIDLADLFGAAGEHE
ncbi:MULTISPECIES: ORF6N domain-containing protein [unclassified Pseudomonas]|uniref:ORF6N domain-containing protein n=1 Tax=unclassified Pseudomonas TaxID=196821 RepID=UPI002097CF4F|nr:MULTISPECIES: ORF6N domain-containing protein [unclassified Pseudomonas]MCO7519418.1 ORF6N domain-containing protein [Pseudomonas sp. 1]MCO7541824.1 ORF6N domain-containing protein [Pseudomonas sp. VA159-2]